MLHEKIKKPPDLKDREAEILVRLAGFEPATLGFVVRYSIQMSYRRKCRLFYHLMEDLARCFYLICSFFFVPERANAWRLTDLSLSP